MGLSWDYHGLSWDYHGMIMGWSWDYHGIIMGLSWDYHGLSWDYHGIIMGLSWHYHGIIMALSWDLFIMFPILAIVGPPFLEKQRSIEPEKHSCQTCVPHCIFNILWLIRINGSTVSWLVFGTIWLFNISHGKSLINGGFNGNINHFPWLC